MIFLLPLCVSIFFTLFALARVLRFRKEHQYPETWKGEFPVCVVRPLHGAGKETEEVLAALCRQNVPPSEIRYGADDPEDSSIPIVGRLKKTYPEIPMTLTIGRSAELPNPKIANLSRLTAGIAAPVLVAIDQDIRVGPSYLENILAPFFEPETGMVTALYRIPAPKTVGSALELASVHVDFFPSVLVGEKLEKGLKFAFGATMAIRKDLLSQLGGFEALGDFLADDYELGMRVARSGHRVVLSGEIVEHDPGKLSLGDYWKRQLRAARTHRVCRPAGYALSVLTQGLPWAAGLIAASGFSTLASAASLFWLASRAALAAAAHGVLKKKGDPWWPLLLLPLHEPVRFVLWLLAFTGSGVIWGGEEYEVSPGGKIKKRGNTRHVHDTITDNRRGD